MKQKWSRQKRSHTNMFAEELPTRMPTYVPTRIDLVPAIVPPKFFNRVVDCMIERETTPNGTLNAIISFIKVDS